VAVVEDVAALVTFGFGLDCLVHFGLSPHLGVFVQSIQKSGDKSGLLVYFGLNAKARLFVPGRFVAVKREDPALRAGPSVFCF
jgi:hypothetical protein